MREVVRCRIGRIYSRDEVVKYGYKVEVKAEGGRKAY